MAKKTIEDMMKEEYDVEIAKADAPVITTTTGMNNTIYGAKAFANLNYEANVFACLPKYAYENNGFRAITAKSSGTAGISEAGAFPETAKPTVAAVTGGRKSMGVSFENSLVHELTAGKDDTVFAFDELREYMIKDFVDAINAAIMVDNQTAASTKFESIDRVCASNAELTTKSLTANSIDIYGLDRDAAASWADAYVDASASNRTLSETLLTTCLATTKENGGNPTFWVTGYSTYKSIIGLFENQARYAPTKVSVGVNGISTEAGNTVGLEVATLYGLPLILSKDTKADTSGINRIYLLDTTLDLGTPRLGMRMAQLPRYVESKTEADMLTRNKMTLKGAYYTVGELICTYFKAQGKIRDLSG